MLNVLQTKKKLTYLNFDLKLILEHQQNSNSKIGVVLINVRKMEGAGSKSKQERNKMRQFE